MGTADDLEVGRLVGSVETAEAATHGKGNRPVSKGSRIQSKRGAVRCWPKVHVDLYAC